MWREERVVCSVSLAAGGDNSGYPVTFVYA